MKFAVVNRGDGGSVVDPTDTWMQLPTLAVRKLVVVVLIDTALPVKVKSVSLLPAKYVVGIVQAPLGMIQKMRDQNSSASVRVPLMVVAIGMVASMVTRQAELGGKMIRSSSAGR